VALQQIGREQLFQQVAQDPGFQQAVKGEQPSAISPASPSANPLEQSLMKSIQDAVSKQQAPKKSGKQNH
jgi:hypothetical protein